MQNFEPTEWTDWLRGLVSMLKVGGVWAAPGPPSFMVTKVDDNTIRVTSGEIDERTKMVAEAAGIEVL